MLLSLLMQKYNSYLVTSVTPLSIFGINVLLLVVSGHFVCINAIDHTEYDA